MLLPRRPAPGPDQAAAAARVRGLLPAPVESGWVPPAVEEEAGWPLAEPDEVGPEPVEGQSNVVVCEPVDVPSPASPTLRERLQAGRLDPGRPAVLGLAVVGVLACLVAGLLVLRGAPQEVAPPVLERPGRAVTGAVVGAAPAASPPPAGEVVVAVAGKVRHPGLVRLAAGSRVDDAVRAAGGLAPGASVGLLNLARRLVDGEQVVVGAPAPAAAGPAAGASAGGAGALVDLNTATPADLDGLPGIGPVLAERIVDYRTAHGPFRSVDQLREVSGIGEAKYQSLRDAVTV